MRYELFIPVEVSGDLFYVIYFMVSDPDPDLIRIQSGQWIRIRIRNSDPDPDPGGQK
jgi:hypothetical protein